MKSLLCCASMCQIWWFCTLWEALQQGVCTLVKKLCLCLAMALWFLSQPLPQAPLDMLDQAVNQGRHHLSGGRKFLHHNSTRSWCRTSSLAWMACTGAMDICHDVQLVDCQLSCPIQACSILQDWQQAFRIHCEKLEFISSLPLWSCWTEENGSNHWNHWLTLLLQILDIHFWRPQLT